MGENTLGRSGLVPGDVVDDWVIEALLASGGQGSVLRARDKRDGRIVAMKVLHPSLVVFPRQTDRFVREVELGFRLSHPNVIEVLELGALADGTPYFVMEYFEGKTLRTILDEQGRMTADEAMLMLSPVCAALSAAHATRVVHRDVKPSNIMIGTQNPRQVKLLDFGVAKLLTGAPGQSGQSSVNQQVGTPLFMAPEQILCGPIDPRTDIYALGAVFYTMVTGRPPFLASSWNDLAQQHLDAPPLRPSQRCPLDPALDAVILRCLEKRPERRFESVEAFRDALVNVVRGGTQSFVDIETQQRAVAILVELHLAEASAAADDEMLTEVMAAALELAEVSLSKNGFVMAAITSQKILGARLLPEAPAADREARFSAVNVALALAAEFAQTEMASLGLSASVAIHVDSVKVRVGAEVEMASGAIARTEVWAPRGPAPALCATREAIAGLYERGFDVRPGPDSLFLVRRQRLDRLSPELPHVEVPSIPTAETIPWR